MKDKSRFAAAREEKTENLFDCADLFPSDASNETSNDGIAVCSNRIERLLMADPYQVNSILAAVICEARGHHPDKRMDSEEALQIAKSIVAALTSAGLKLVAADNFVVCSEISA